MEMKTSNTQNTPRSRERLTRCSRTQPSTHPVCCCLPVPKSFSVGESELAAHQDSYKSESQQTPLRLGNWSGDGYKAERNSSTWTNKNIWPLGTTEIEELWEINTVPCEEVLSQLVMLNCQGTLSAGAHSCPISALGNVIFTLTVTARL